jgi:hypothetical protein
MVKLNGEHFGVEMVFIRMAVFGYNSNGDPDIFFCSLHARQQDVDDEDHYDMAELLAERNGYEAHFVCDEFDPAGAVMQLCCWDTVEQVHRDEILEA